MNNYKGLLNQVLKGELSNVAQECFNQRELISLTVDESLERQLLAFRLALKAGNSDIPVLGLNEEQTSNSFLKGEILFFKGTYFGQFHQPHEAIRYFELAKVAFANCQEHEKELLSEFNSLMGQSNAGILKSTVAFNKFNELKSRAESLNLVKISFLCRRQLSYMYFDDEKYDFAIKEFSINYVQNSKITKSDLDLSYLHLADCYFQLGDLRKALATFDLVAEENDERVQFPKAYVASKIFRTNIEINKFNYISNYWKIRYNKFANKFSPILNTSDLNPKVVKWDLKSGYLIQRKKFIGKVRPLSLMGQLIQILKTAPRSKSYICESLWPGELTCDYLNDRFHQLILRTNRKIKKLIVFDGQFYKLNLDLKD